MPPNETKPSFKEQKKKEAVRKGSKQKKDQRRILITEIYSLKFLSLDHHSCTSLSLESPKEPDFLTLLSEMLCLITIFIQSFGPLHFFILLIFRFASLWPLFLYTVPSSFLWLFSLDPLNRLYSPDLPGLTVSTVFPRSPPYLSLFISHTSICCPFPLHIPWEKKIN